jgi:hypothetical protein
MLESSQIDDVRVFVDALPLDDIVIFQLLAGLNGEPVIARKKLGEKLGTSTREANIRVERAFRRLRLAMGLAPEIEDEDLVEALIIGETRRKARAAQTEPEVVASKNWKTEFPVCLRCGAQSGKHTFDRLLGGFSRSAFDITCECGGSCVTLAEFKAIKPGWCSPTPGSRNTEVREIHGPIQRGAEMVQKAKQGDITACATTLDTVEPAVPAKGAEALKQLWPDEETQDESFDPVAEAKTIEEMRERGAAENGPVEVAAKVTKRSKRDPEPPAEGVA